MRKRPLACPQSKRLADRHCLKRGCQAPDDRGTVGK
jgi:hypothetical protein